MTAIIILNWNGWQDTIACLKSLYNITYEDFFVVIVDNGSTDDSCLKISQWFQENHITALLKKEGDIITETIHKKDCIFLSLQKNYGFAKGNNLGIALVNTLHPSHYLCLNNDTEVTPDFLDKMFFFQKKYPQYQILTPQIRYVEPKDKIWNCGGKIFFGLRKYYFSDTNIINLPQKEFIPITFITGCALLFNAELIDNHLIFSERFFFGEEDFEFSLRMKENQKKMACVLNSIIYHKVGSSTKSNNELGKIYIYYLNRFINIKLHFSKPKYRIWKFINLLYINYLLSKKFPKNSIKKFLKTLQSDSERFNTVDQRLFEHYITKKNLFL